MEGWDLTVAWQYRHYKSINVTVTCSTTFKNQVLFVRAKIISETENFICGTVQGYQHIKSDKLSGVPFLQKFIINHQY
jgi:hypothetical protein